MTGLFFYLRGRFGWHWNSRKVIDLSKTLVGTMAIVSALVICEGVGAQEKTGTSGAERRVNTAVTWPNDGRFLGDRIDARLRFAEDEQEFSISTRPGQMFLVSIPVEGQPQLIRKYGILLQPEDSNGTAAKRHTDVPPDPKNFTLVLYCLEETPPDKINESAVAPSDLSLAGVCQPRDRYNQFYDDARFMASWKGIRLDRSISWREVVPALPPIELEVVGYAMGANENWNDRSPMRLCLDMAGIEVCACQVSSGIASVPGKC